MSHGRTCVASMTVPGSALRGLDLRPAIENVNTDPSYSGWVVCRGCRDKSVAEHGPVSGTLSRR